jgi:hypothetical protein
VSGAPGSSAPRPATLLSVIDVSNPAAMKVLQTVRVDGSYVSARLVDGEARIITTSNPPALPFVYPSSSTAAAQEAATTANKAIIASSTIDDWLPTVQIGNGTNPETKPLLDCAKVSHPKTFSGFTTLSVLSVDLGSSAVDPADGVGIMADGQTVYASKANLYVATPAYVDPPRPASPVPPGTDPTGTGTMPPTSVAPAPVPLGSRTAIHKFDIAAHGPAVYRASGEIAGTVLNQYSMSEDDGSLRVASSTTPTGCLSCRSSDTAVHVLQEKDGQLEQVGEVGDMGHGEQVKAVRFVGKQGYVVTYRQTDPLYTLDLSVPTAPKVVGALQLLGYSAYLHPVGDHLLIGIGQDATAGGRALGTKVALYDVSDLANPRDIQHYVLWNTTSKVEQDFHAFLWWQPTQLAMIPVDGAYVGYIDDGCPAGVAPGSSACTNHTYLPPFTGAIGLHIDPSGIKEVGRVVNPASGSIPNECGPELCAPPCPPDAECTTSGPSGPSGPSGSGAPSGAPIRPVPTSTVNEPGGGASSVGAPIIRSVVVGDTLYTLSSNGLKSSELATLQEKYWLPFG